MKGVWVLATGAILLLGCHGTNTSLKRAVPQEEMEKIYNEVKTPFKYGVVFKHPDSTKMIDSPLVP